MSAVPEMEPQIAALRRFARALVGTEDARQPELPDDLVTQALDGAGAEGVAKTSKAIAKTVLFGSLLRANRQRFRGATQSALLGAAEFLAAYERSRQASPQAQAVQRALDHLPLEYKEVLLLVSLEGFTYVEAAQALETPLATVLLRLTRARDALNAAVGQSTGALRDSAPAAAQAKRGRHLRLVQ